MHHSSCYYFFTVTQSYCHIWGLVVFMSHPLTMLTCPLSLDPPLSIPTTPGIRPGEGHPKGEAQKVQEPLAEHTHTSQANREGDHEQETTCLFGLWDQGCLRSELRQLSWFSQPKGQARAMRRGDSVLTPNLFISESLARSFRSRFWEGLGIQRGLSCPLGSFEFFARIREIIWGQGALNAQPSFQ